MSNENAVLSPQNSPDTKIIPLYIYGASRHHIDALKATKAGMTLPLVQPVVAQPGQGGRVLAFGSHPEWVCDSYLVVSPDVIPQALEWALNGGLDDENVRGYAAFLTEIFGEEVREIDE